VPCTQSVAPSRLVLADGNLYNIEGLESSEVNWLVELAHNTSGAAVPEAIAKLAI
jgi:hypothetical protein